MTRHMLIPVLMGAFICAAGGCQFHPRPIDAAGDLLPPPPTPAAPFHVSDIRVQTLPPLTLLSTSINTSFEDMPGPASLAIDSLQRMANSGQPHQSGPLLIYHDPSENLAEPFDLDIGLPILGPPPQLPGYTVQSLPKFRCATAIYRGPMKLLPKAYDKIIPQMIAAGLIPSEITRESYLVWESADSPNNVVQIQVGIQ